MSVSLISDDRLSQQRDPTYELERYGSSEAQLLHGTTTHLRCIIDTHHHWQAADLEHFIES